MGSWRQILFTCAVGAGLLWGSMIVLGQTKDSANKEQSKEQSPAAPLNRITVEVTGGDSNKPIENASVYVKTVEERAMLKDKKTELNVKTNQLGVAHIPEVQVGRVLVQVVAEGWKTYGHWYDITDPKQVIKIHLDRPPKWY